MLFQEKSFSVGDVLVAVPVYGWGWRYISSDLGNVQPLEYDKISKPKYFSIRITRIENDSSGTLGAVSQIFESIDPLWNKKWLGFYCHAGNKWDVENNLCPFTIAEFFTEDPYWFPHAPSNDINYIQGNIIVGRTYDIVTKWSGKQANRSQ